MNENNFIINVTKEEILRLLAKSFEEGYAGYLDLREDCVNSILEDFLNSNNIKKYTNANSYYSPGLQPMSPITGTYNYGDYGIFNSINISNNHSGYSHDSLSDVFITSDVSITNMPNINVSNPYIENQFSSIQLPQNTSDLSININTTENATETVDNQIVFSFNY